MPMLIDAERDETARAACRRHDDRPDALIEILHAVQADTGHISDRAIQNIADALNLTRAEVLGVVSFYHDFRRAPGARHELKLCRAEACQAAGGEAVWAQAELRLGAGFGETTPDGEIALAEVFCLGNCALAPAALIDGEPVGRLTPQRLDDRLAALANTSGKKETAE